MLGRAEITPELFFELAEFQCEVVEADALLFDVENFRPSRWIPYDDATFERQKCLGRKLQDTVGIGPIDTKLSPIRSICGINRVQTPVDGPVDLGQAEIIYIDRDTAKDAIDEFLVALEPDCGRAVTNGRPQRSIVRGTRKCALQGYFRLGFDKSA